MFKVTSVKKWSILLVALLVCATVVLAACNTTKPFEPVDMPTGEGIDSNGGIAVRYGDYVYYVNGYQSNASAENTYVDVTDAPRVGSVVRIKLSEIEKILEINDDKHLSSSQKSKNIAAAVRGGEIDDVIYEGAETVIPNIYYSSNTTTPALNGIYIFNNRIYITTPNDKLTAGGNTRTNESVLTSFKLDGSDPVRHFEFSTNSAQIWLYENADNKVCATYVESSKLYFLDVAAGESTLVTKKGATDEDADDEEEKTVSSVNFDKSSDAVFFIDGDGALCKLAKGEKEYDVILENEIDEDHGHPEITYTIKSVNNGYVYYTVSREHGIDETNDLQLYYAASAADAEGGNNVALASASVPEAYGWNGNKLVVVLQKGSYYGLFWYEYDGSVFNQEAVEANPILKYEFNGSSLTNIKIEGDTLYYTKQSVTYTIDLNDPATEGKAGTPYAYSMATSATGWALPDVIEMGDYNYVFTVASGSVSIVKFDPVKKTNSTSTALTLTAAPEEK